MTIYATRRPGPSYTKNRHACPRCGIEHTGRQDWCTDCTDVEFPKPCKVGHERTEDNVYIPPTTGRPQCGACRRTAANLRAGWEWSCQACGCRADQGEVLCRDCGQVSESHPCNDRISGTVKTPAGAVTPRGRGPLDRSGRD